LARQQAALLERRHLLDRALAAISEVQLAITEGKPTAVLLRRIIEAIKMQNNSSWMMSYYSPEAQTKNFRTGQLFHARNASSDSASLEIVLPRCRRP
jgi:hypothetical protein